MSMRYQYWFSFTFHVVFPRLSKHFSIEVCDLVLGVAGTKLSWGVVIFLFGRLLGVLLFFFGWGGVEIFRLLIFLCFCLLFF